MSPLMGNSILGKNLTQRESNRQNLIAWWSDFFTLMNFCCSSLTRKCKTRVETSERKKNCLQPTEEAFTQGTLSASPPPFHNVGQSKVLRKFPLYSQGASLTLCSPSQGVPSTSYSPVSQCCRSSEGHWSTLSRKELKVCRQHWCFLVEASMPTSCRSTSRTSDTLLSKRSSLTVYRYTKLNTLNALLFLSATMKNCQVSEELQGEENFQARPSL